MKKFHPLLSSKYYIQILYIYLSSKCFEKYMHYIKIQLQIFNGKCKRQDFETKYFRSEVAYAPIGSAYVLFAARLERN